MNKSILGIRVVFIQTLLCKNASSTLFYIPTQHRKFAYRLFLTVALQSTWSFTLSRPRKCFAFTRCDAVDCTKQDLHCMTPVFETFRLHCANSGAEFQAITFGDTITFARFHATRHRTCQSIRPTTFFPLCADSNLGVAAETVGSTSLGGSVCLKAKKQLQCPIRWHCNVQYSWRTRLPYLLGPNAHFFSR